jgi:peptidoglycan hydrolase CwlO-like protein
VAVLPRPAGASSISSDRAKATELYNQIQSTNAKVELLGQRYDEAQIKLDKFNNQISHTKETVAAIKNKVTNGTTQLRNDAIFAYVTNGAAASNNPLFSSNA